MRKKVISGLLLFAFLATCLVFTFPGYTQTFIKRLIGVQDIFFATGGTGAAETFTATDSSGRPLTFTKPDATHLKFRSASLAGSVEDFALAIINGVYSYTLKLKEVILKGPEVDARAYGTAGTQAAIVAALADIGSKQKTLVLYPSLTDTSTTWALTADQAIPANVSLKVSRGAVLTVATGKTLTINGPLEAELYQIFSCTGTGKVVFGTHSIKEALPEWWGATANGSTDDYSALQKCLDSNAATIKLQDNVIYRSDSQLTRVGVNTAIRGFNSTLDFTNLAAATIDAMYIGGIKGDSAPLTASPIAGATAITCALDVVAGDKIILISTDQYSHIAYSVHGEFATVQGVSAGIITLRSPLYAGYTHTITTAYKLTMPSVELSGLTLLRTAGADNTVLRVDGCSDVVVRDCKINGAGTQGFMLQHCYGVNIYNFVGRNIYRTSADTDDSYGIVVGSCQDVVIDGANIVGGRHSIAMGGPANNGIIAECTPFRNVKVVNCTLDTDNRMSGFSGNSHSNGEYVEWINNFFKDGIANNAANTKIIGNTILTKNLSVACQVGAGGNSNYYFISNNWIVGNSAYFGLEITKYGVPSVTFDIVSIANNYIEGVRSGLRIAGRDGGILTIGSLWCNDNLIKSTGSTGAYAAFSASDNGATLKVVRGSIRGGSIYAVGDSAIYWEHDGVTANNGFVDIDGVEVFSTKASYCFRFGYIDRLVLRNSTFDGNSAATYNYVNTANSLKIEECTIKNFIQKGGLETLNTVLETIFTNNRWVNNTGTLTNASPLQLSGFGPTGKRIAHAASYPTTNTWEVGDIIWATAPAASGTAGWVCTTAGAAPATAKFAPIATGAAVP